MYDVHRLSKDLRQSEHETAHALYQQIIGTGFTAEKAISLVYRAGVVDGRRIERERAERNAYFRALHSTQSPPEAEPVEVEEGSHTNERY